MTNVRRIQLDVTGMTCRMCSAHIERKLNKISGVRASVDFPTKTATIDANAEVSVDALCEAIQQAGYHGELRSERPLTAQDSAVARGAAQPAAIVTRLLRWGRRTQEA